MENTLGKLNDQKESNKCHFENCNKKLKLSDLKCKCNKIFCMMHKFSESHNCKYDYRSDSNKVLTQNLIKISTNRNLTKI